jgi:hypothetical protein
MLGGGSSVASAFLAKLGGGANVPATNGPTAPASILSLVKVGPLPMSKVWAFRRQSPSQPASELGIQLNRSCVITKVIPGSFADDAHVTSGLIVAKVNDNLVKTEAEFIAHVQRSVDCCILFFEGDAVTELITQVMNATYDAQGLPNEPPFAQLLAENPARYGFLSVSHPLHLHWRDRADETRKARDALRAMELGDDEEQRQKDEKKRAALAAEIDNLDDLLASDNDDDAPAPAHSAVARRDDMSHQQQQQQQQQQQSSSSSSSSSSNRLTGESPRDGAACLRSTTASMNRSTQAERTTRTEGPRSTGQMILRRSLIPWRLTSAQVAAARCWQHHRRRRQMPTWIYFGTRSSRTRRLRNFKRRQQSRCARDEGRN